MRAIDIQIIYRPCGYRKDIHISWSYAVETMFRLTVGSKLMLEKDKALISLDLTGMPNRRVQESHIGLSAMTKALSSILISLV